MASAASLVGGFVAFAPAHAGDYGSALSADRIADILARAQTERLRATPVPAPPPVFTPAPFPTIAQPPAPVAVASSQDLECLAAAVYYEARGEPAAGQAAVAQVVLNRARRPHFPKTVCGVVYQHAGGGCQFSFACNGAMNRPRELAAWFRARTIAARALAGYVMADIGQATSFHAARSGTGGSGAIRVGAHVFFAGQGDGGVGHRDVVLARNTATPPQPRYTFSLGVLTEISTTRRAPVVLAPASTAYPRLNATNTLPSVSPAAS